MLVLFLGGMFSLLFGLMELGLLVFHMKYVLNNSCTIEDDVLAGTYNPFRHMNENVGRGCLSWWPRKRANWAVHFGDNPYLWPLPIGVPEIPPMGQWPVYLPPQRDALLIQQAI